MARLAIVVMAALWSLMAGVCILVSLRQGWDGIRIYFGLHFGWAAVGCVALAVLISRGSPLTKLLMWFVLPFCILIIPIGPALALYAAHKLEKPEMKEYLKRQRAVPSTAPVQPPPP
jgi:hypothetical protein